MGLYLGAAALSLWLAAPDPQAGGWKLLGMAELCLLAVITADLVSRPEVPRLIARVIVATSLVTAAAAVAGLLLFYAGFWTRLVGSYGDLVPSLWYARIRAGAYSPNSLASFCIFASAVIARGDAGLPAGLRRAAQGALWVTVGLTFSRGILAFSLAAAIRAARNRWQRFLTGMYAVAGVGIIAALTVWNLSLEPMHPLGARLNDAPSSRRQAMTSSLRTLAARPLWGSGPGHSPGEYRGRPFDAHCTPLNIAATLGLPALAAFAAWWAILWRGRSRPTDLALWGGLAGMALDALAQDIEDFRHLWVMAGLAEARAR
jgi:hypothetical protein